MALFISIFLVGGYISAFRRKKVDFPIEHQDKPIISAQIPNVLWILTPFEVGDTP